MRCWYLFSLICCHPVDKVRQRPARAKKVSHLASFSRLRWWQGAKSSPLWVGTNHQHNSQPQLTRGLITIITGESPGSSLVSLTIMGQGDFFLPISGTTWSKPQIASRNLADMAGARSHDSHCHVSHFVTFRNPETVTTFLTGSSHTNKFSDLHCVPRSFTK